MTAKHFQEEKFDYKIPVTTDGATMAVVAPFRHRADLLACMFSLCDADIERLEKVQAFQITTVAPFPPRLIRLLRALEKRMDAAAFLGGMQAWLDVFDEWYKHQRVDSWCAWDTSRRNTFFITKSVQP